VGKEFTCGLRRLLSKQYYLPPPHFPSLFVAALCKRSERASATQAYQSALIRPFARSCAHNKSLACFIRDSETIHFFYYKRHFLSFVPSCDDVISHLLLFFFLSLSLINLISFLLLYYYFSNF